MGMSRGFRRLIVVIAFLGIAMLSLLWLMSGEEQRIVEPLVAIPVVLAIGPAILVLLIGWVVMGFRNSN
jgi:hypothetical protein